MSVLVAQLCLCDPVDCSPPGLCPWNSPSRNTGGGCHALLQRLFLTQGPNLHLLQCVARSRGGKKVMQMKSTVSSESMDGVHGTRLWDLTQGGLTPKAGVSLCGLTACFCPPPECRSSTHRLIARFLWASHFSSSSRRSWTHAACRE